MAVEARAEAEAAGETGDRRAASVRHPGAGSVDAARRNNIAEDGRERRSELRGTYERPVLFGHADVERGEVIFEGRRYKVTRGAIEFTNPNRIEPFFDVEAETKRPRPRRRPTASP